MPVGTTALILGSLAAAQTAKGVIDARSGAKSARKVAGFQAGILEDQAADTITIGNEAVSRSQAQTRGLTGAQNVSLAAQGLDTTSGSAADVISNDQRLGAIDALTLKNNAAREALGLRKQAELVRKGGQAQAQGFANQATGTLLSGATSLYGIYDAYGKTSKSVPRSTSSGGGTYMGKTAGK